MSTDLALEVDAAAAPARRRKRKPAVGFAVPAAPSTVAAVAVVEPVHELDEGAEPDPFVTGEKIPRRPTGRAGWFIDGR